MRGYGISVKVGLLDKKHRDAMGEAVWLFLWFLDKMTMIDKTGMGIVLGGKPISHSDVESLFPTDRTYRRYLKVLQEGRYISTTRTPYGYKVKVYKAEKIWGDRTKLTVHNHINRDRTNLTADRTKVADLYIYGNRQDNDKGEDIKNELYERWKSLPRKNRPKFHIWSARQKEN